MAKSLMMIIGIVLVLVGILGLVPSIGWFKDAPWIAWAEIIFGTVIVMTSNKKTE